MGWLREAGIDTNGDSIVAEGEQIVEAALEAVGGGLIAYGRESRFGNHQRKTATAQLSAGPSRWGNAIGTSTCGVVWIVGVWYLWRRSMR